MEWDEEVEICKRNLMTSDIDCLDCDLNEAMECKLMPLSAYSE